ncbi:MAG: VOC family protein [Thermoleophilia bacterium]|nr:VOC family protein [Thermoleophilia bacterium]
MDHVGIVVDDLAAAAAFFIALGLEREGDGSVTGPEVDRIVGLDGVQADIVFLRPPNGHGGVELVRFRTPEQPAGDAAAPAHVPGLRHVAFRVDDADAALERLRGHAGEPVGAVEEVGGHRLVYVRGPAGIIVELAQRL